ncbi:Uncharacterized protein ToN1_07900 [Aromatoleum petrolei]|nr:Uncharacterized protein ToN1_07900 [Aromatoleum petrolei]
MLDGASEVSPDPKVRASCCVRGLMEPARGPDAAPSIPIPPMRVFRGIACRVHCSSPCLGCRWPKNVSAVLLGFSTCRSQARGVKAGGHRSRKRSEARRATPGHCAGMHRPRGILRDEATRVGESLRQQRRESKVRSCFEGSKRSLSEGSESRKYRLDGFTIVRQSNIGKALLQHAGCAGGVERSGRICPERRFLVRTVALLRRWSRWGAARDAHGTSAGTLRARLRSKRSRETRVAAPGNVRCVRESGPPNG